MLQSSLLYITIASVVSNIIAFTTGALVTYLVLYIAEKIHARKNLKKSAVIYSKDLPHQRLVETVKAYLDKNATVYRYDKENYYFELAIDGAKDVHDVTALLIYVEPDTSHINFKILICNMIPDSAVPKVAEFVTRMNSTPNLGHYTFNYEERYCLFTYNLHLMNQPLVDHIFSNSIKNLIGHYIWTAKAFSDISTNNHDPLLTYMSLVSKLDHNSNT